jgi:hypothetical protein
MSILSCGTPWIKYRLMTGYSPTHFLNLLITSMTHTSYPAIDNQECESSFEGKVAESKLTGELKTSRGTYKSNRHQSYIQKTQIRSEINWEIRYHCHKAEVKI